MTDKEENIQQELSFYEEKGRYRGVLAWLMSTDHKRIGLQYLMALMIFFAIGVTLGIIMRLSLISPGWLFGAQTYDEIFTTHGIIMIFRGFPLPSEISLCRS